MSICTETGSDRFSATTVADADQIRVEPSTTSPRVTASEAYAQYLRQYHQPTKTQAPALQVRYGVLTDGQMGVAGGDGPIPIYRRTHAWVISLCDSPRPPWARIVYRGRHSPPPVPDGGLLVVEIADQPGAPVLTGHYIAGNSSFDFGGMGVSPDNPDPAATPYVSVRWHLVARQGDRALLRYQPVKCHTLDHVNVDGDDRDTVSVLLSGGPGQTCPAPSALQPYIEVTVTAPNLKHGPLGPQRFQMVRS